jgi:nicotinamidase-related amidase
MPEQQSSGEQPTAPFHDAPETGGAALLIIDLINTLDFSGAAAMRGAVEAVVEATLRLRDAADAAKMPVIYVNDNFGEWHSEQSKLVARAHEAGGTAAFAADRIAPREGDFFIIKPQFSGFYATNLPVLLPKLGVSRLILTGIAADVCVLFTAGDAHMRDYDLWVPEDAVAAEAPERKRWALETIRSAMGGEIAATHALRLADWLARPLHPERANPAEQEVGD